MGVRGELFSTKVGLQNRTYFFNVKENRLGDLYLNIVESKNKDEGGFDRQSLVLFAEDLQEFLQGFDESLKVLEKAAREKRKGPPKRSVSPRGSSSPDQSDDRPSGRPPRRTSGTFEPRGERRFGESRYPSSREREERSGEPFRRERPVRPRSEGFRSRGGRDEAPFRERGRSGRDDREGRGEAPRRSRTGEKAPRKSEGRPRREGYAGNDKPPFPPKKRVVVKKR